MPHVRRDVSFRSISCFLILAIDPRTFPSTVDMLCSVPTLPFPKSLLRPGAALVTVTVTVATESVAPLVALHNDARRTSHTILNHDHATPVPRPEPPTHITLLRSRCRLLTKYHAPLLSILHVPHPFTVFLARWRVHLIGIYILSLTVPSYIPSLCLCFLSSHLPVPPGPSFLFTMLLCSVCSAPPLPLVNTVFLAM